MSRGNTVKVGIFVFICIIPEQFIIFLYHYTTAGIWKVDDENLLYRFIVFSFESDRLWCSILVIKVAVRFLVLSSLP